MSRREFAERRGARSDSRPARSARRRGTARRSRPAPRSRPRPARPPRLRSAADGSGELHRCATPPMGLRRHCADAPIRRAARGRGTLRSPDSRGTPARGRTPAGRKARPRGARRCRRPPAHREPAPGVAGGDRLRHPALGVEAERRCDLLPRLPEHGGRPRPDQADEFVRAQREAAFLIHLPDEAQRMTPLGRRRRRFEQGGEAGDAGALAGGSGGDGVRHRRSAPAPARGGGGGSVRRDGRWLRWTVSGRLDRCGVGRNRHVARGLVGLDGQRKGGEQDGFRLAADVVYGDRPVDDRACGALAVGGIGRQRQRRGRRARSRREAGAAAGVAWMSSPSGAKAATGWSHPASRRRTRSSSASSGPARSVATTRMAAASSVSAMREHAGQRAPDAGAESRAAARCAASRPAAGWSRVAQSALPPADRCRIFACGSPPSWRRRKSPPPVGFAHRMRLASALHSHAGSALVAIGASRSSRSNARWNPDWLIERRALRFGAGPTGILMNFS